MYISVDKDVLCTADASTTWSQGDMSLEKLQKFLEIVLQQQQILGMDICGECDPDACERNLLNDRANQKLLELWKNTFRRSGRETGYMRNEQFTIGPLTVYGYGS